MADGMTLPACPICKQADQVRHGRYNAGAHASAFMDWRYYLVCDRCRVRVEAKRNTDCETIWTGGEEMKYVCGCGKEVSPEEGFMALNAEVKFFLCKECQEKFWKWLTGAQWWVLDEISGEDRVSIGKKVDWLEDGCPGDRTVSPHIAFKKYMEVDI